MAAFVKLLVWLTVLTCVLGMSVLRTDDAGRTNAGGIVRQNAGAISDKCADGKEGATDCKNRNAKCHTTGDDKYECRCETGFGKDKESSPDWKCIGICEEGGNGYKDCEPRKARCSVDADGNHKCDCSIGSQKDDAESPNWKCVDAAKCTVEDSIDTCEEDEMCKSGFCQKNCSETYKEGVCKTGELCQNGACQEICSKGKPDGACDVDQLCKGGQCQDKCSKDKPNGVCEDDNQLCKEEMCQDKCSETKPNGVCEKDNQLCKKGQCKDKCSETKPDGVCKSDNEVCKKGKCKELVACKKEDTKGECEEDELCKNELCQEICSATKPDGVCMIGRTCQQGKCLSVCEIKANKERCALRVRQCEIDPEESVGFVCQCPIQFELRANGACKLAPYLYTTSLQVMLPAPNDPPSSKESVPQRKLLQSDGGNQPFDPIRFEVDMRKAMREIFGEKKRVMVENIKQGTSNNVSCDVTLQFEDEGSEQTITESIKNNCTENNDNTTCQLPSGLLLLSENANNLVSEKVITTCKDTQCLENSKCETKKPAYYCKCKNGYKLLYRIPIDPNDDTYYFEVCTDFDECATDDVSSKCHPDATCLNIPGSYSCICKDGYKEEDVSAPNPWNVTCIDVCDSKPCKNGKCSKGVGPNYLCECDEGYYGQDCGIKPKTATVQKGETNTIIVGAVLGSVLLLTFIGTYIIIRRLKKKYKNDNEYERQDPRETNRRPESREMSERPRPAGRTNYGYRD